MEQQKCAECGRAVLTDDELAELAQWQAADAAFDGGEFSSGCDYGVWNCDAEEVSP